MAHASLSPLDSLPDQMVPRQSFKENPEFDITAMVDLVFMMNIYFLVTFVTVAMAGVNLPSADHCAALDADTAVVVTLMRSLDGESVDVYLADGEEGEPLTDSLEQEQRSRAWVEEGVAEGKTAVLLKAERKVRLADLFRISSAVAIEGIKLHVAVMEKDAEP